MQYDLSDLDDYPEIRDLIAPYLDQADPMLEHIGQMIAKKRDEAKKARSSSGLEVTWTNCEDAYSAIDDSNRAEARGLTWSKPYSIEGPLTAENTKLEAGAAQSNVFIRMTSRYVDAGSAKLQEILLPADDKAFSLRPTPEPDLIQSKDDHTPVAFDDGTPMMRTPKPEELPQGASPIPPAAAPVQPPPSGPGNAPPIPSGGQQEAAPATPTPAGAAPPLVPITKADFIKENMDQALAKALRGENQIFDWMKESNYTGEMRKVIFDSARLGVGILKGPFPMEKNGIAALGQKDGSVVIEMQKKIIPGLQWVSPWNIYPDPGCGEKIGGGEYCFERDWLSESQLLKLKGLPGYISSQIDLVIEEGPSKVNLRGDGQDPARTTEANRNRFEAWHFHGVLSREDMECLCAMTGDSLSKQGVPRSRKTIHAIVTLVNDHPVRATLAPLDSGKLPYHNVPWQRRPGHWAGIGVAEQLTVPQRMVNGATRAMLNNAGVSAGPQIVINRRAIKPADGRWEIRPNKPWFLEPDYDGIDVRQCFMVADIPNVTQQIMQINEWAMRLGEESTSIPLVTQGQSGATTPDTYGAAQLQNNNANQLLRAIGYIMDDYITEPVVTMMYEYLLLDPDVPEECKGDFQIVANGSIALVERAIQDQTITQLLPFSKDPAFGLDPEKTARLYLKSKKLDPNDVQLDEQQKKMIASQPPPEAPAVTVAKINAQLTAKRDQDDAKAKAEELKLELHKIDSSNVVDLHTLEVKRELAMLEYANTNKQTIDQVKGKLAEVTMKLTAQERMEAANRAQQPQGRPGRRQPQKQRPPRMPQPVTPPTEPAGRAPNGASYEA